MRHITISMICTSQHNHDILLKNTKQTWKKNVKQALYYPKHTIQEILGNKCEIHWQRHKTHTFSWRLVKKWGRIWRVCVWTRWFWKRERQTRRWIVTRFEEKWKLFETCLENDPHCAKHVIFATEISCEQVTKNPYEKIWKNIYLNIYREWKFHSRGSRVGSCEIFWVTLATGASTCEQVTKLSHEKSKIHIFENVSMSFSRLGLWLAIESREPFV